MAREYFRAGITALFFAAITGAQANTLSNAFGPATGYNAFVFGNFADTCCDVGGNLAVGGTTSVNNFGVAQSYFSASAASVNYSYIGMGALSGSFGLNAGNGYYAPGGTFNGPTYYQTAGGAIYLNGSGQTIKSTGGSGIDFSAAQSSLTQYSSYLYGLAPTTLTTADPSGGFDISAQNTSQTNVATLTAAQFAAGALHINIANGATLLINVIADGSGNASTSTNGIFVNGSQSYGNGAAGANNIVFNFTGGNFYAHESIVGTVLAPYATFNGFSNLQLDGALIAQNFTGATEFHDDLFTGSLPATATAATPEPTTFFLLGSGLVAVGLSRKKWMKRQ